MTLEQLLLLVVDGGAGLFIYSRLEKAEWYQSIEESDYKRWIAAGLTALFAILAWGVGVALEVFELPTGDWRTWVIKLAEIGIGAFVAFGSATLGHTKVLKKRR